MFPLACWNESYYNQEIGKETRLFLVECSMFCFMKFYEIKTKINSKTNIMPQIAINRGFSTVAIVWKEFSDSTGVSNFALHGTMLQEHYQALVRGIARNVDRLENTLNCISKSK